MLARVLTAPVAVAVAVVFTMAKAMKAMKVMKAMKAMNAMKSMNAVDVRRDTFSDLKWLASHRTLSVAARILQRGGEDCLGRHGVGIGRLGVGAV